MGRVWLGLDIGGTKVAAALVDGEGRVREHREAPTLAEAPWEVSFAGVVEVARALLERARQQGWEVPAVGVGCPGPLDARQGVMRGPPNLPLWDGMPVRASLEEKLGLPIRLANDGNLAALAEARYGAGRGCSHLVFFGLGTGIGGGVICEGRIFSGARGAAGELGHLVVEAGGRPCSCGGRGCVEAYASGPSLARRAQEALARKPGSALAGISPLTPPLVVEAARAGDPLARQVWEETVRYLAAAVVSAVHAFNPEVVVVGGGMAAAGDILFAPLRSLVREWGMRYPTEELRILPAALGRLAGVIGAAALAQDTGGG